MTDIATPQVKTSELPVLRAAYADRTAALMATLARLAYDFPPKPCDTGPAPELPPEFKLLGFERITYFHNGLTDGWAYIVAGPDLTALVFRGTASTENWKTNFQAEMLHPPKTDLNLRVHEGFYKAFSKLSAGKLGLRDAMIEEIKTAAQGDVPIYLAGHSLGGALAQIAAATFGCDQIAACYTFGSPRVGNAYFDLWVKPPSYRIENYADIVPQVPLFAPALPPELYRHSGDPRYLADRDQASPYRYEPGPFTRFGQFLKGLVQLAYTKDKTILGIEDHRIQNYEAKLKAIAAARSQAR